MGNKNFSLFLLLLFIITVVVLISGFGYIHFSTSLNQETYSFGDKPQSNGYNFLTDDDNHLVLVTKINDVTQDSSKVYIDLSTKTKNGVKNMKFVAFDPKVNSDFVIENTSKTNDINTTPPTFLTGKNQIYGGLKKISDKTVVATLLLNSSTGKNYKNFDDYAKCNSKFYQYLQTKTLINCSPYIYQLRTYEIK